MVTPKAGAKHELLCNKPASIVEGLAAAFYSLKLYMVKPVYFLFKEEVILLSFFACVRTFDSRYWRGRLLRPENNVLNIEKDYIEFWTTSGL